MMSIFENRIKTTVGSFILVGVFTLLEYLNGGVASHHLLAREDLPEISNWWGLLTVPILTWVVHSMINKRSEIESQANQNFKRNNNITQKRFLLALLFGISISVLWELGLENVLQYFILIPIVIAVFKPVHYPEFLLAFVIGMIYTFGGILPIIIGLVLMTISFMVNKFIQLLKTALVSKQNSKNKK